MAPKRTSYSYEVKCQAIADAAKGVKRSEIVRKYGVKASTLGDWIRNKTTIEDNFKLGKGKVKRLTPGGFPKTESCLVKWFATNRNNAVPIDSAILLCKAKEYSVMVGEEGFSGSKGWLHNIMQR
ncbi:unnamed protein product, partial [Meganyctiphanes norvegica]